MGKPGNKMPGLHAAGTTIGGRTSGTSGSPRTGGDGLCATGTGSLADKSADRKQALHIFRMAMGTAGDFVLLEDEGFKIFVTSVAVVFINRHGWYPYIVNQRF